MGTHFLSGYAIDDLLARLLWSEYVYLMLPRHVNPIQGRHRGLFPRRHDMQ